MLPLYGLAQSEHTPNSAAVQSEKLVVAPILSVHPRFPPGFSHDIANVSRLKRLQTPTAGTGTVSPIDSLARYHSHRSKSPRCLVREQLLPDWRPCILAGLRDSPAAGQSCLGHSVEAQGQYRWCEGDFAPAIGFFYAPRRPAGSTG
jgi:hypothetical protein